MRFLVYLFLFVGSIYLANLFYGPVIKNHMLEGKMINLATERRLKDDRYLLADLLDFIEENKIEVDAKQITLYRSAPKEVTVSAKYKVYRKFWFMEKEYLFTPTSANEDVHGILPDFAAY